MCVITYYLHQHVLVTLMTTFRASLDKNTINILTPSVQDVYETAPSLQPNSLWRKFIKSHKVRYQNMP